MTATRSSRNCSFRSDSNSLAQRLLQALAVYGLIALTAFSTVGCKTKVPTAPPADGAPSSDSRAAAATSSASAESAAPALPSSPSSVEPRSTSRSATDDVVPQAIEPVPVTMQVSQRTTTAVPGAAGELSVTVDDITRGQVMISLLDKRGVPLAGPASIRQDQSLPFRLGGADYAVRVAELSNLLVGDDSVTIVIERAATQQPVESDQVDEADQPDESDLLDEGELLDEGDPADEGEHARAPERPRSAASPPREKLSEKQLIDRLLAAVAEQRDAKFIRNGTAYSAGEAAEHLRLKANAAGSRITTAAEFIDKIGTKSSLTGKAYLIEFPDGRVLTAGEFLRGELSKL